MYIKKTLISIISMLIAVIWGNELSLSAFATNIEYRRDNASVNVPLDEAIKTEAKIWANNIYYKNVEIERITRIIEPESYGFCVSFIDNDIPCGYAVFVYCNDEFQVTEYSDVIGTNDIYTSIKQNIVSNRADNRYKNVGDFMFKTGPMDYAVGYITTNGELHNEDNYGNDIRTPKYVAEKAYESYKNYNSIFISIDDFTNTNKYKIIGSISYDVTGAKFNKDPKSPFAKKGDYKALCDDWYKNVVKKYNCGLTADLHILAIRNQLGNFSYDDIRKAYKKLMNMATSKKITSIEDGITYYSMYAADTNSVLKNYCKLNSPYKVPTDKYAKNPSSTWLKTEIMNNRPIVLSYHINTENGKSGHAVTVFSFRKAKKISSGNTYNYIGVFDGWTNTPRFINYTTVDFTGITEAYSYNF